MCTKHKHVIIFAVFIYVFDGEKDILNQQATNGSNQISVQFSSNINKLVMATTKPINHVKNIL